MVRPTLSEGKIGVVYGVRARWPAWAAMLMLVAEAVLGGDYAGYGSGVDGWADPTWSQRAGGYSDQWTRDSQPWMREESPNTPRSFDPWEGNDGTPYGGAMGSNESAYRSSWDGQPVDDSVLGPDWNETGRYYGTPIRNGMMYPRPWKVREPIGRPPDGYDGPPRTPGWGRDEGRGSTWRSPNGVGGDRWQDWHQDGPGIMEQGAPSWEGPPRGGHGAEQPQEPWGASYTPERERRDAPAYDREPDDGWTDPWAEWGTWDEAEEERPWGRRRQPTAEQERRRQRWQEKEQRPLGGGYAYGEPFGAYEGSWYYPRVYGAYPPAPGLWTPWSLYGLSAWDTLNWGFGSPWFP